MVTTKFLVGLAKMFLLGLLYLGNISALIQITQVIKLPITTFIPFIVKRLAGALFIQSITKLPDYQVLPITTFIPFIVKRLAGALFIYYYITLKNKI